MQSRGCFASAFALKTFNGVKLCGHLLWSEASILHKDIYICCMENCGILYVAVILRARMWIEIVLERIVAMIWQVILRARMWIEISLPPSDLVVFVVILRARMWIEMLAQGVNNAVPGGHPPCEDVD